MIRPDLIAASLPIVDRIAQNFVRRLPAHVDRDAVRSAAREGLVRAASRFDPAREPYWPAYAHRRVVGAMIDECRRLDPAHNRVGRPHVDSHAQAIDELADLIGTSEDLAARVCARLDLRRALAELTPRQRHVLVATQIGARTADLGAELGITASRVSQLRYEALEHCREVMAA